jgi:hypothetical protein
MTSQSSSQFARRSIVLGLITIASSLATLAPAIAQDANFGSFTLNPKTRVSIVDGNTGGSTSLPAVTANNDEAENQCIGFGDPKPDHVMKLGQKFDKLKVTVNSNGGDTTLIIKGPDGSFRCADDFNGKDAGLEIEGWKAGSYMVWVGSMKPNARRNYQLTVQAL